MPDLECGETDHGCDEPGNEAELGDRCGDSRVDGLRGSVAREGCSYPIDSHIQYPRIVRELAYRPPGTRGDGSMGVGFCGEERAERRKLAEDLSASLRVGNGVYWFDLRALKHFGGGRGWRPEVPFGQLAEDNSDGGPDEQLVEQ